MQPGRLQTNYQSRETLLIYPEEITCYWVSILNKLTNDYQPIRFACLQILPIICAVYRCPIRQSYFKPRVQAASNQLPLSVEMIQSVHRILQSNTYWADSILANWIATIFVFWSSSAAFRNSSFLLEYITATCCFGFHIASSFAVPVFVKFLAF